MGVAALEEANEAVRKDVNCLTLGSTTYETASIYAGKAALLDLVRASLKRSAQQALRENERSS